MSQQNQVLRCYQCNIFQVHIVKKNRKFDCKVCGEKQSIKKVYHSGPGNCCRDAVKKLNMLQINSEETITQPNSNDFTLIIDDNTCNIEKANSGTELSTSNWKAYLEKHDEPNNPINSDYTFMRPVKKSTRKQKNSTTEITDNEYKESKIRKLDEPECNRLKFETEIVTATPIPNKWAPFLPKQTNYQTHDTDFWENNTQAEMSFSEPAEKWRAFLPKPMSNNHKHVIPMQETTKCNANNMTKLITKEKPDKPFKQFNRMMENEELESLAKNKCVDSIVEDKTAFISKQKCNIFSDDEDIDLVLML